MVLGQSMGEFVTQIVMFFGARVMMFLTNGLLALTAVAAMALGFGLDLPWKDWRIKFTM